MEFKVGDKVRTNAKWNKNQSSEGTVTRVSLGGDLDIIWHTGLCHANRTGLFLAPGRSDWWPSQSTDIFLYVVPTRSIKPGDRVRVVKGHPQAGTEGTVLISKPWNGDPHMVLITSGYWLGRRMSFRTESLEVIAPVVEKVQYHEAIDTILPFV